MRIAQSLPMIFLLLTVSSSLFAQKSTPVMEYASVLTGIRVRHATGALEFENSNHALAAVFLPSGTTVEAIVTKKGSKTPLVRQTFAVSRSVGAFRRLAIRGNHHQFKFTQPGDYVLTYRANGRDMTSVPFSVEFVSSNDEFNPKVFAYLNGPQRHWAYLYGPLSDAASDQPEFRMWARKKSFVVGRDADKYDVEVRLNGEVVAITNTGFISTQEGRELKFPLRHPDSKGSGALKVGELTRTDGTYHVVVIKNGDLYSVWPFTVNGGKFKLHPRQESNYSPRTDYIVPRVSGITDVAPGTAVFMERLSDGAAEAIYSGQAASVAGPTEADRKRWEWLPRSIDPRRPFKFTV